MTTGLMNPPTSSFDSSQSTNSSVELETVPCLLCGDTDEEIAFEAASPEDQTRSTVWRMVRCRSCGLHYTSSRPVPAAIGQFYPDGYECHDLTSAWDSRLRLRLRRRFERAVLRTGYGYPPRPVGPVARVMSLVGRAWIRRAVQRTNWIPFEGQGRLVDFGCGAGEFLQRMQQLGWSVQGIDVSPDVAEGVSQRLGIPVHVGTLPHVDVPSESADVVTMWQALEHVHDPRTTLRSALQVLRPGGQLHLSVPNVASRSFRVFGEHWHGLELPRHLTHFNPETMRAMLVAEGFEIETVKTIGRDGWIRRSAQFAVERGAATAEQAAAARGRVARAWARQSERNGDGDMILAVARRP